MIYLLILLALSLLTAGQLLQKVGVDRVAQDGAGRLVARMLRRVEVWWALFCMALGTIAWLLVLYHMEVSKAFPFLSLQFVMVALLARFYFHETVVFRRWLGVGLIVTGVLMVAGT